MRATRTIGSRGAMRWSATAARAVAALLLLRAGAAAQERPPAAPPPPPPAPPPAVAPLPAGQQQPLQALVIASEGRAEWKAAAATTWRRAAVNDLLDAGAEIRTGLRSTLTLRVGKNATLLVDRSSRVELPLMVQDGAVLRTRAAVYRGRCDVKVEEVGITSDFAVLTPSATLAVRGTGFSVAWGALAGLEVKGVDTNRIRAIELSYLAALHTWHLSGAGESSSDHPDPVVNALFDTVFPPPWPDRALGGPDDDPLRLPHPLLFDIRRQQRVDQGGSDFGQDTKTGRGTPGQPPSHG